MNKQFFSNNYDINYNDYLNHKKGKECIKKLVSDKKYYVNSFINYETFLTLSKAFYKQINNNYDISPMRSISDANTSYKCYKSVESHVSDCKHCCSCKNISQILYCKEIQNILYPYGESVVKRDDLNGIYYPRKLKLDEYCCKKCEKKSGCECEKPQSCSNPCGNPCGKNNVYNLRSCNSYNHSKSSSCCNSECNSSCNTVKGKSFYISNHSCPSEQSCNNYCGKNKYVINTCKKYNFHSCECKIKT